MARIGLHGKTVPALAKSRKSIRPSWFVSMTASRRVMSRWDIEDDTLYLGVGFVQRTFGNARLNGQSGCRFARSQRRPLHYQVEMLSKIHYGCQLVLVDCATTVLRLHRNCYPRLLASAETFGFESCGASYIYITPRGSRTGNSFFDMPPHSLTKSRHPNV